jgi:hypothetical protein
MYNHTNEPAHAAGLDCLLYANQINFDIYDGGKLVRFVCSTQIADARRESLFRPDKWSRVAAAAASAAHRLRGSPRESGLRSEFA